MKSLAERRAFFDRYTNRIGEPTPAMKAYGIFHTCPCCGYPTLSARSEYQICFLCSWEDDGQDDRDADLESGPNHEYTLVRARENFPKYLVMYEPGNDPRLGGQGDSPAEVAEKRKVIAAFDAMNATLDDDALWKAAHDGAIELNRLLEEFVDEWDRRNNER